MKKDEKNFVPTNFNNDNSINQETKIFGKPVKIKITKQKIGWTTNLNSKNKFKKLTNLFDWLYAKFPHEKQDIIKTNKDLSQTFKVPNNYRIEAICKTLMNCKSAVSNEWKTTEREKFILTELKKLGFVKDGSETLKDPVIMKDLKKHYKSKNCNGFTTNNLKNIFPDISDDDVFIIYQPFGPQMSPDFLIITNKGIYGLEDKSSKNGKISWNTGTPAGNKIIMYFDKKEQMVFLITAKQWGWDSDRQEKEEKLTKELKDYTKAIHFEVFGEYPTPSSKAHPLERYARPMFIDPNQVKDICDPNGKDVIEVLLKVL
jgi:hypothetical protein